jgi:HAD superfamily hydrolase (TIGR01549 family)
MIILMIKCQGWKAFVSISRRLCYTAEPMKKVQSGGAKAVDLVVFDLDGTLVDGREDISRAVNQGIVAVGGEERPASEIIPHIGRPLVHIFEGLLPRELLGMADRAVEIYRQYFFDHCAETSSLYPGVAECLEAMSSVSRAVATTKMTFMAAKVLQEMGIAHHFDLVQGSEDIPHKPDPAVLTRVLERLGKRAHRSWIVGDTVYDIQAGKAACMRTCAVTYGIGLAGDLKEAAPDLLLDTLVHLPSAIGVS